MGRLGQALQSVFRKEIPGLPAPHQALHLGVLNRVTAVPTSGLWLAL